LYSVDSLLKELLGVGDVKSKGNKAYFCPFCKHHKKKLEVHPDSGRWNCWVCNTRGLSIYSLLKKLDVDKKYFNALSQFNTYTHTQTTIVGESALSLPRDFTPLYEPFPDSFESKRVISYLSSRGVTEDLIKKYKIGYCPIGSYQQRIIIPSYDRDGRLNFFVSRAYRDNTTSPYRNPNTCRDIVFFESYINFDEDIILTEAVFDAITLGKNSIPLLGKFMSKKLKRRIMNGLCKNVFICLDPDAYEDALVLAKWALSIGKTPFIMHLVDSDPNEIGRERLHIIKNNSQPVSEFDLIKLEIDNI